MPSPAPARWPWPPRVVRVYRDRTLPGAMLTRVAASHLRVGSFQYLAARGQFDLLRQLLRFTLQRHYPALVGHPEPELALLRAVSQAQAKLIAQWMNVGFIHGVMNTDNMALSGQSIDFGPCAFLEAYDPATKFSSIDRHGRYAYGNQPAIAQWNLARLAEALLPLMADPEGPQAAMDAAVAQVTAVLDEFPTHYEAALRQGQAAKLGLAQPDGALADDWLALLRQGSADFTLAWRELAEAREGHEAPLRERLAAAPGVDAWLTRWRSTCSASPAQLRAANPAVIPRNHRVEEALTAASEGDDLRPFNELLAALRRPFDEDPALARFTEPAPAAQTACYKTFCGT